MKYVYNDTKLGLIRLCHQCGKSHETQTELERCPFCQKSLLPAQYFQKIHDVHSNFSELFSPVSELEESDLIKGIMVIW